MARGHQRGLQDKETYKFGPQNGGFVLVVAGNGRGLPGLEGSVGGAMEQQLADGGLGTEASGKGIPRSNAIATSARPAHKSEGHVPPHATSHRRERK